MKEQLQQHVEGRAATLRILEWVEAFASDDLHASFLWELLTGGYEGDEEAPEADYAFARWERVEGTEGTAVMAYLVPVLA